MLAGQAVTTPFVHHSDPGNPVREGRQVWWLIEEYPNEWLRWNEVLMRGARCRDLSRHAEGSSELSVTPGEEKGQHLGPGIPRDTIVNASIEGGRASCTASL